MTAAEAQQLHAEVGRLTSELASFNLSLSDSREAISRSAALLEAHIDQTKQDIERSRGNVAMLFDARNKHSERLTALETTRVTSSECVAARQDADSRVDLVERDVHGLKGRMALMIGAATVVATLVSTILHGTVSALVRGWVGGVAG